MAHDSPSAGVQSSSETDPEAAPAQTPGCPELEGSNSRNGILVAFPNNMLGGPKAVFRMSRWADGGVPAEVDALQPERVRGAEHRAHVEAAAI